MDEISIFVVEEDGSARELRVPTGFNMSLMEALKAYEEPIEATCGGMALCATCHVEVMKGYEATGERTDDEEAMLDTLPDFMDHSRLSCQIRVTPDIDGLHIRYVAPVPV